MATETNEKPTNEKPRNLRPIRLRRATPCLALDQNGGRCRRTAVRIVRYHGSGEMYGFLSNSPEPEWVAVPLCDRHSRTERPQPSSAQEPE